jgi:hypothetical protein
MDMTPIWWLLICPRDPLEEAADGDEVFRDLVLARIIEPTSKLDSARALEEAGVVPASYPTIGRRLRAYAGGLLAGQVVGVRGTCRAGPSQPGPVRRQHPVFRDRCR